MREELLRTDYQHNSIQYADRDVQYDQQKSNDDVSQDSREIMLKTIRSRCVFEYPSISVKHARRTGRSRSERRYIYSISKRDELRKKAMKRSYEIGIGNLFRFRDWKYENQID